MQKFSQAAIMQASIIIGVLATSLVGVGCAKKDEPSNPVPAKETSNQTSSVTTSQVTPSTSTNASTVAPADSNNTATAKANKGETLYQNSCRVCHDTGNLGSPRLGDKAAWKDRIAQGNEVLYNHAIMGFTGKSGTMPPKGASNAPDSEIKEAVDYMVSKAK